MRFLSFCIVPVCLFGQAAQTPEVLSETAQSLARESKYGEAEQSWKQAIALSPGFFPALFNLGYFYFKQQRFSDAEPLLRRAAQASPTDFNAHYLLGATLAQLGQSDDALRAWREALRIQPDNLRLLQVMCVEYSKGRYFAEAASLATRALNTKTDDPGIYFLAIKAYQDAGDDNAAFDVARRAVQKFPESARANSEYAFHLQKQGKIPEALDRLKRAMAADSSYEEPFFLYGNLLVQQGLNAEAVPYLRTAIKNRNEYFAARMVLARALMNQRKWPEAVAELQTAMLIDPKHPQPHLLLSQIFFRLGDEAKASEEQQVSLRLRRENPAILEAVQPRTFR
ncbi:MAG: tetratricopeptide repeat protein [Acidobacteriota bacterium]|nr:tetratricopeptide repeat protein [Acidobacteriota bacterium]